MAVLRRVKWYTPYPKSHHRFADDVFKCVQSVGSAGEAQLMTFDDFLTAVQVAIDGGTALNEVSRGFPKEERIVRHSSGEPEVGRVESALTEMTCYLGAWNN